MEAIFQQLDQQRLQGASHEDLLDTLMRYGVEDPAGALVEYTRTPLPDGRPRGQVNLGDPAEREAQNGA